MPNVLNNTINERIGVYYTGYMFSLSSVIFRENVSTDIGIDAQIELVDSNGVATGMLAGLQIKSGDSFVNIKKKVFSLQSDKNHLEYWSRFVIPVIGIIYSVSLEKAVWFDLKELSLRNIEQGGIYRVSVVLDQSNELNERNIRDVLTEVIRNFYKAPVSKNDAEKIAEMQDTPKDRLVQVEDEKKAAWKRMVNILLVSRSDPDTLAEVGYRLSWYFSRVSQEQRDFFIERISNADDIELANVIIAISAALAAERDDVAELVCDLLTYIPNPEGRLRSLARQKIILIKDLEALFQSIERFTQECEDVFRKEVLDLYGIIDTDIS